MPASRLGLLELAFVFGVGLAWAAYEWWSRRKPPAKAPPPADPPSA